MSQEISQHILCTPQLEWPEIDRMRLFTTKLTYSEESENCHDAFWIFTGTDARTI